MLKKRCGNVACRCWTLMKQIKKLSPCKNTFNAQTYSGTLAHELCAHYSFFAIFGGSQHHLLYTNQCFSDRCRSAVPTPIEDVGTPFPRVPTGNDHRKWDSDLFFTNFTLELGGSRPKLGGFNPPNPPSILTLLPLVSKTNRALDTRRLFAV